jgi:hypothetical protein
MWAGCFNHSWQFGHEEALSDVVPEMPDGGSKTSTVPVVWENFFGAIWRIAYRNWWPWKKPGYITMTRWQSNNQWSGGIAAHPAPKNYECKNPLETFSARFFGIKTASSSLIIFQRAKLSTRSITHLCWCLREGHQRGLVLARQCPGSPDTCNPEITGLPVIPTYWLPTLFSGSGPVGLLHDSWTEKNNWKVDIFRPKRTSLLPRRHGWTEKLLNFFEWLANVRARYKKCTELRGEFGRCSLFPSWSGQGLISTSSCVCVCVCIVILKYITNAPTCFSTSSPPSGNFDIAFAKVIKY